MSILSALKQQNSTLDDLAALPQAMIMQMAQKKQISEEMLAPILARKAEMADAFARQNAMQGAGQVQPTVMEQLMAQNAQAEQPQMAPEMQQPMPQMAQAMPQGVEDVGIASQATQPMGLAGGGIIAFADGGMSDEDDTEDAREESDYTTMMNAAMSGMRNIPNRISEFASRLPKSYEAAKAELSQAVAPKMGGHKYEEAVIAEAKKQGVDPKLALHVLYKETGGHKNPDTAKSHAGAFGPMQLMPKTAKSLGVDPTDPMQNIHGGVKYLAQLGPMFDNDPRLVAAAYNAGPGNVRKYGGVPSFKETQNYVKGLANGGEVRHFANEGYVDPFGSPDQNYDMDTLRIEEMQAAKKRKEEEDKYDFLKRSAPELAAKKANPTKKVLPTIPPIGNPPIPQAGLSPEEMMQGSTRAGTWEALGNDQTTGRAIPQQVIPKSGLETFMEQMVAQKTDLAKQRQEDKNMALLAAGLGMLGGTSQHAGVNIGQGALAGVQNLSEARKARAAEQNAIDRNILFAHRYQGVEDVARQNAAAQQAYRGETLKETSRANTNKEIEQAQNNLNNYIKIAQANLKDRFPAGEMDERYQAEMAKIYKSPQYIGLSRRAGLTIEAPTFPGFSAKMR